MKDQIKNFFQNPFAKAYENLAEKGKEQAKEQAQTLTQKKALGLYKDKPFTKDWSFVYLSAKALMLFANILSLLTAFFALDFILSTTLGPVPSLVVSGLLTVLIELVKNSIFAVTAKQFFRYKKWKPIMLGVLVSLVSIGLSGLGAWILPEKLDKPEIVYNYTAQDSSLLAAIELEKGLLDGANEQIALGSNSKYKGNVTRKGLAIAQSAQGQIQSAKASLDSLNRALEKVHDRQKEDAKAQEEAHKNKAHQLQIIALLISVFFELVYIACAIFSMYYLFRAFVETVQDEPESEDEDEEDEEDEDEPYKPYKPETETETNPKKRVGIGFHKDNFRFEDGIKFYLHSNGKKYTYSLARNNLSANRSKYKKYLEQGNKEQAHKYKTSCDFWEQVAKRLK